MGLMDVIGVGLQVAGSVYSASQAQKAANQAAEREAQAQELTNIRQEQAAQKQMDFQERMSSTAHQREVKDLREAGLNPILSARYGGSSTPSGSLPVFTSPYRGYAENVTGGTARMASAQLSSMQRILAMSEIQVNKAQAAALEAQAVSSAATAAKTSVEAERTAQTTRREKPWSDLVHGVGGWLLNVGHSAKNVLAQINRGEMELERKLANPVGDWVADRIGVARR